jgi:hypothetical protein
VGEKGKGHSLLVACYLLAGDLGIHEQPGKQLAKLHVVGALAELPRLIDAAIKDPDVRVAAHQGVSGGRSNAVHDAPDGRHDLSLGLTHGHGVGLHQGIPKPHPRAGHGYEGVRRKGGGERRRPSEQLTTVHVVIRPDGHDGGNPRVRPSGEESNSRFVAEQLETLPTGGSAQQLPIEVVRLLVVVDPSTDERNQALGLGQDDPIGGRLAAELGDQSGVGPAELPQHNGQAVDAGCCHGLLLPQAS